MQRARRARVSQPSGASTNQQVGHEGVEAELDARWVAGEHRCRELADVGEDGRAASGWVDVPSVDAVCVVGICLKVTGVAVLPPVGRVADEVRVPAMRRRDQLLVPCGRACART
jgi:hypothetical protein